MAERLVKLTDGEACTRTHSRHAELVVIAGFGAFQIGMVTYTGLTWLADAAEMILLSFVGPAVCLNPISGLCRSFFIRTVRVALL